MIHYSNIKYANVPLDKNICLDPLSVSHVVTFNRDLSNKDIESTASDAIETDVSFYSSTNVYILDTPDLVERTYLAPDD